MFSAKRISCLRSMNISQPNQFYTHWICFTLKFFHSPFVHYVSNIEWWNNTVSLWAYSLRSLLAQIKLWMPNAVFLRGNLWWAAMSHSDCTAFSFHMCISHNVMQSHSVCCVIFNVNKCGLYRVHCDSNCFTLISVIWGILFINSILFCVPFKLLT